MLCNLISTLYSLASSFVLLLGLTLKPIIIASLAFAKTTSLSVIAPVALLITLTFTPSTLILRSEFLTASSLPLTSAFNITLISFFPPSIFENKSSSESDSLAIFDFCFAFSFLVSAIAFACFSVSKAINLSPALGSSVSPVISTGVLGRADAISIPKSFFNVLTLPNVVPTTTLSPNLNVPFCINNVTTDPTFLSNLASITLPIAYLFGFAFRFSISAVNSIVSRSSSIPSPVSADILINVVSPPHESGVNPASVISVMTLSTFAVGLSILLIATIIGTFAALA